MVRTSGDAVAASTRFIAAKLRRSNIAPHTSSTAAATSAIVRAARKAPPEPVVVLPARFRTSVSETRADCHAGARPATSAVTMVRAAANAVSRQSNASVTAGGSVPGGRKVGVIRTADQAKASPIVPPPSVTTAVSVRSWRTSRAREPPSAARTASSRERPTPRATRRLATFAQAISSTKPTTPPSTIDVVFRSSLTIASRSGSTVMPQSLFVSGAARPILPAMPRMSLRAVRRLASSRSRPTTWR